MGYKKINSKVEITQYVFRVVCFKNPRLTGLGYNGYMNNDSEQKILLTIHKPSIFIITVYSLYAFH